MMKNLLKTTCVISLFVCLSCKLKEISQFGRQIENLVEETSDIYDNQSRICNYQYETERFLLINYSELTADELNDELLLLEDKFQLDTCHKRNKVLEDFKDVMISLGHIGKFFRSIGEKDRYVYQESRENIQQDLVGRLSRSRTTMSRSIKIEMKKLSSQLLVNTPQNLSRFGTKKFGKDLTLANIKKIEAHLKSAFKFTRIAHKDNKSLKHMNDTLWTKLSEHYTRDESDDDYTLINESKEIYTRNHQALIQQSESLQLIEAGIKEIINQIHIAGKKV